MNKSYEDVLNSNKPDSKLEFFWLTFKDSIKNYLNEYDLEEMNNLSDVLNSLQREERYEEIEEFIKQHIENIGYNMIARDDRYHINHIDTNIKRWKKLSGSDIYPTNNTFICILYMYIHIKDATDDKKDDMNRIIELIKEFALDRSNRDVLNSIMNILIRNKMFGSIDKMRNIIDITMFLRKEYVDKVGVNRINVTKSNKLAKYFLE